MKAAAISRDGAVAIVDRPSPTADGDLVTVEILIAPMCTEFKLRRSGKAADSLGHEAVGIVLDAGSSARVRPGELVVVMPGNGCGRCGVCQAGDHIYCQHQRDVLKETGSAFGTATFAEVIVKPDWLLLRVPEDIQPRHAALTICALGPGLSAVERTRIGSADTVVLSGAGPVGLGAVIQASARSAEVHVWEPNTYRQELALALGARTTTAPPGGPTSEPNERIANAAIETSGHPDAPTALLGIALPLARIALIAWGAPVSLPPLVSTGVEIHACWHWNHLRCADVMWQVIRDSSAKLDRLVTHEYALDEVAEAMDVQALGECGKVLLYTERGELYR